MKYIVICYAIHNKQIASFDPFETEEEAQSFLEKDANNTYQEEYDNCRNEDRDKIDLTIDDGSALLSSYDGEYEWTWEIITV